MGEQNGVGVHVTLREIYDAALMAAKAADGGRSDIAALRKDFQTLDGRVAALEKTQQAQTPAAYLRQLGVSLGLIAGGVAAGWAAFKGG